MAGHGKSDLWPALTGLIVGASVVFALVFGIVEITNSHYASSTAAETK